MRFFTIIFLMAGLKVELMHLPMEFDIHGMDVISPEIIYVCGKGGLVLYSSDGGKRWTKKDTGYPLLLTDIDFIDEKKGWVAGERGIILFTDDGGTTWKVQRKPVFLHLLDLFFLDELHGWAVGDWGEMVITDDGGKEWRELPLKLDARKRGTMEPVAGEDIKRGEEILVKKGDFIPEEILSEIDRGGIKGYIRNDVVLNSALFFNEKEGLVVGEGGRIFWTDDGGKTFKEFIPMGEDFYGSFFSAVAGEGEVIVGGGGGVISKIDLKTKKVKTVKKIDEKERGIYSMDMKGRTICIAGEDGLTGYSSDGGDTFEIMENEKTAFLWFRRAVAIEEGTCLFGGKKGTLVRVTIER